MVRASHACIKESRLPMESDLLVWPAANNLAMPLESLI